MDTGLGVAPSLRIGVTAQALLNAILTQLESNDGWTAPPRVGFVPGSIVAYDGEQLTVNYMSTALGFPGEPRLATVSPYWTTYVHTFSVNLLRRVKIPTGAGPGGGIPSIDGLIADAERGALDAGYLLAACQTIQAEGLLVPVGIPFKYGPLQSVGPDGGLAGSRIEVELQAGTEGP